ncbi:WD40-repeat-containing domain [Pseudocohnilembus persalinus]|uniref:WD40-repeat-containing domain n=1 Tax=Pseudocohnilembus persalinus TaxID=266149 RepID=A0A0V0R0N7_PSEPJ|nr:WD40-repeat-containing domain [Pseudocohnilembus persalinus]|eukprot:KRX07866.1 WD40-repeat-containing domain [Pseudocohnilembus persalinus]
MDTRNFRHLNHINISDPNNITNFVGFLSDKDKNYENLSTNDENLSESPEFYNYLNDYQYQQELDQCNKMETDDEGQNLGNYNDLFQANDQYHNNKIPIECIVQERQNLKNTIINDLSVKLMTGSNDNYLKIFDLEKSKEIAKYKFQTAPNVGEYNHKKQLIAVQCDQMETEIMDARTLKPAFQLVGHEDYGFSVDWNKDGYTVATGNQDGTVRIFDIRKTNKCVKIIQGELGHTCCVKYTDQHLIVGESIDYLHIFDLQRDYQQQKIDFFGELNGVSVIQDQLFFGVDIKEFDGIFQYKLKNQCEEIDILKDQQLFI